MDEEMGPRAARSPAGGDPKRHCVTATLPSCLQADGGDMMCAHRNEFSIGSEPFTSLCWEPQLSVWPSARHRGAVAAALTLG